MTRRVIPVSKCGVAGERRMCLSPDFPHSVLNSEYRLGILAS